MSLHYLLFQRFREIGSLGRLVLATSVAAVAGFVEIFVQNMKAASNAGTHVAGQFTITVCYFGPPPSFYPKFLIAWSLVIAGVGVFRRSFPRSPFAIIGLIGALTTYIVWWIDSYRVFRNFADLDIPFMKEIKQTAYLHYGTWLDAGIAASVAVCLVLLLDRFFRRQIGG